MAELAAVIQFEMAIRAQDGGTIAEACEQVLEEMRRYGAACVVGSYSTSDYEAWPQANRSVTSITIQTPVTIEVDR